MTTPKEITRVIGSPGRLKTHSLSDVSSAMDSVETFFALHSVAIGKDYLRQALDLARATGQLWEAEKEDFQPHLNRDEQAKLLIAYRTALIAEALAGYHSALLPPKLALLTNNTLDPSTVTVSDSRNTLFELEMLARLRAVNGTAELRPEPGADLKFSFTASEILVECKFINGANTKTVIDRIADAEEQLRSNPFGVIAIELDPFVPHDVIYAQANPQIAYRLLAEYTQAVFETTTSPLFLGQCRLVFLEGQLV